MNCLDPDQLYRDSQRLKNRTNQLSTLTNCLKNDLETQKQIVSRQKNEILDLRQEIKTLKKRREEEEIDHQNVNYKAARVIEQLEEQVQEYKSKYQKLQSKIMPLVDQDTVRLKILNEVEGNHQLEINVLKNKIDILRDDVLKYRRENQVLHHQIANLKMNREEEMRHLKSQKQSQFAQESINYLTYSMWKNAEAQLKNSYENAKKQAQFYKEKYFAAEKKYHAQIAALEGS